ncbi:MAG: antibiotic biosynthesis monooxygenase [Chloroflexi bacterium]|nr:antibiotic biosynthesis monooxygenase [Chloroflexota bacterium]
MAIYRTAQFKVRLEGLARCEAAIQEFIQYIAEAEEGTLQYISLQDEEDPTSFLHVFIFGDAAAQELHSSSEAVQRFTGILYSETIEPVAFKRYRLVAASAGNAG